MIRDNHRVKRNERSESSRDAEPRLDYRLQQVRPPPDAILVHIPRAGCEI